MTGCTFRRYEQLETSPETNEQKLRPAVCKHRQTDHFSTAGLYSGPAHYDVSIRQAAIEAFVKSSFKIFLTQTFPRCGATCYILPSRVMSQLFNGVNCVSLRGTFCRYLRVLVRIRNFYNSGRYLLHIHVKSPGFAGRLPEFSHIPRSPGQENESPGFRITTSTTA